MLMLAFFKIYALILWKIAPLVSFLILTIVFLGWRLSRREGWSFSRGQYCAFITATTVGYGAIHPTTPRSRFLSIIIAVNGLLLTGMLVALAYQSLQMAALYTGLVDDLHAYFPNLTRAM